MSFYPVNYLLRLPLQDPHDTTYKDFYFFKLQRVGKSFHLRTSAQQMKKVSFPLPSWTWHSFCPLLAQNCTNMGWVASLIKINDIEIFNFIFIWAGFLILIFSFVLIHIKNLAVMLSAEFEFYVVRFQDACIKL